MTAPFEDIKKNDQKTEWLIQEMDMLCHLAVRELRHSAQIAKMTASKQRRQQFVFTTCTVG